MRCVELFAGVGGFRLGLERAGHEVVWANEWSPAACDIYDKNFPGRINRQDITTVSTDDIPDHDFLVGGFPCQAFSMAGKRRGFDDTRGTLFFDIARILRDKRPAYLLLENVKGLLTHDSGKTFSTILGVLADLGYVCEWGVLNSENHGVPQSRERVFIVGYLRDSPRPETLFEGLYTLKGSSPKDRPKGARVSGRDSLPTLRATEHKRGDSQTIVLEKDGRFRWLTPLECERLQGFPDNWTEGVAQSERLKQMGNAVTTNVIYEIAKRLPASVGQLT